MASWKLNGIVLDSDDEDEDDLSDSEEIFSGEIVNRGHDDLTNGDGKLQSSSDSEDELAKDGYGLQFVEEAEKPRAETADSGRESRDEREHIVNAATDLPSSTASTVPLHDERIHEASSATAYSETGGIAVEGSPTHVSDILSTTRRTFKVPLDFDSLEERKSNASDAIGENSSKPPESANAEIDEISTSYVGLSSQPSSPLSPILSSPITLEEPRQVCRPEPRASDSAEIPSGPGRDALGPEEGPRSLEAAALNNTERRPLRKRTIRQTNPYTVENREYREKFRTAGLKPIVIPEDDADEKRRRRHAEDSQEQLFETEEDSQTANFVVEDTWSSSQPQPVFDSSQPQPTFDDDSDDPFRPLDTVQRPNVDTNMSQDILEDEDDPFRPLSYDRHDSPKLPYADENQYRQKRHASDVDEDSDELPEIEEIIRGQAKLSSQASGSRKRPRTYKTNRSVLSATSRHNEPDIYDFPPSPPITSPTPRSEVTKRMLQRVGSLGTRTSSPLAQPINVSSSAPQNATLQNATPAQSVSRRSGDVILLDSDSENEDHPPSSEGSRSSSPEPEDLVRAKPLRLRGVLPASWVRLDKQPQAPKSPPRRILESESPSPERSIPRRGIAVRKTTRDGTPSMSHDAINPYFLEDESDTDAEDFGGAAAAFNETISNIRPTQIDQSIAGSIFDDAIEDDRIDPMLPSRKRSSTFSNSRPSKKRRVSSKLFHRTDSGHARQPKITEQFERSKNRRSQTKNPRTQSKQKTQRRKPTSKPSVKRFVPPMLSILDVAEPGSQAFSDAPAFIRIASRNARSRRKLGRHSPTRKFIRLDNVEDTNDAQSVLREWREGTILPNSSLRYAEALPVSAQGHRPRSSQARNDAPHGRTSRILVVSKAQQTTLDRVVQTVQDGDTNPTHQIDVNVVHRVAPNPVRTVRNNAQPLHHRPHAQPAQLETEERDYNRSHPNAGFGTTKKGLDRLYRRSHRGVAVKGDVQLARFLADPDAVGSVADDDLSYQADVPPSAPRNIIPLASQQPVRRRKKIPQHLDAGAHRYRQPSEPLPLDNYLESVDTSVVTTSGAGKLLGLQPYGTRYTHHFDVFPLQFGIFFHESTFIGSSRLSRVLDTSFPQRNYQTPSVPCSYLLDEKRLCWAEWNATVSSEIGLCFDWISGQLEIVTPPTTKLLELVDFILIYVDHNLYFVGQDDQVQFIRRMCDVVDGFLTRACGPENVPAPTIATTIQHFIEVLTRTLVLQMQLFQMCQKTHSDYSLLRVVEDVMQRITEKCAALLISLGLSKVREFYEHCQYLSSREAGVRRSAYYVEAWVIMMKVMQAAKIPRSSFWDIVNKQLIHANLDAVDDARALESMWYNMFTLLPLTEFDNDGVVRPGLRHTVSFDNWTLPQKLMKRIFAMYGLKSRQSAGFNDYVRSLFIRCHYLMIEWGWQRCGGLIGTLFDFFASHNLANLRNEESYDSPRFLEELDMDISLSVEAEDKCFHIFLKIIATFIKRMRQVGDNKGIRNLVTRLLPNHDRQYPKEEVIHQRDLAALRNHHDLLCTLFWAAPVNLRPSVALFQQLVIPERSHKEACLINLRAWSSLAKFLLASSPVPEEYQQLVAWQKTVFSSLMHRYQTAGEDIRQQHAALPEALQQQHTEKTICDTIDRNKEQTIEEINCHIRAMILHMKNSKDIEIAKTVFIASRDSVTSVLGLVNSGLSSYNNVALEAAFQLVNCYFLKIDQFQVCLPALESEEREASILGGAGYLSVFEDNAFLAALERIVSKVLQKKLKSIDDKLIMEVWAKVSACQARREDFFKNTNTFLQTRVGWVSGPPYPVGVSKQAQIYAPLFTAVFVQQLPASILKRAIGQRDLFQEWLCSIAKPSELFRFEYYFTLSIVKAHQLPSALLRDNDSYLPRYMIAMKSHRKAVNTFEESTGENKFGLSILKKDQLAVIEGVIKYISDASRDSSTRTDRVAIRSQRANILNSLMTELKNQYIVAHENKTTASINYQQFVRQVISSIKKYANDCPLDKFFTEPGIYYHFAADGPNFFVPNMISKCLQISNRGNDQAPLWYSWESIKGMVRTQECGRLPSLLMQVMDHDLKPGEIGMNATKVIVMNLAPAAIWASWRADEGFIIADMFLAAVEEQVLVLASIDMWMAAEMVLPVVRHVIHGVWAHARNPIRASRPYLYLITRVVQFMTAIWHVLAMAAISHSDTRDAMRQFAAFIKAALRFYEGDELILRLPGQTPDGHEIPDSPFGREILKEYASNWEYRSGDGSVWMRPGGFARTMSSNTPSAPGEVLVRCMGGESGLRSEQDLARELVDALKIHNELLDDGDTRKRDLSRAVTGLEDIGL